MEHETMRYGGIIVRIGLLVAHNTDWFILFLYCEKENEDQPMKGHPPPEGKNGCHFIFWSLNLNQV